MIWKKRLSPAQRAKGIIVHDRDCEAHKACDNYDLFKSPCLWETIYDELKHGRWIRKIVTKGKVIYNYVINLD